MSKASDILIRKALALQPKVRNAHKTCTREELELAIAVAVGKVTLAQAAVVLSGTKTQRNGSQALYRVYAAAVRQGMLKPSRNGHK
jgi:hypothetical protein